MPGLWAVIGRSAYTGDERVSDCLPLFVFHPLLSLFDSHTCLHAALLLANDGLVPKPVLASAGPRGIFRLSPSKPADPKQPAPCSPCAGVSLEHPYFLESNMEPIKHNESQIDRLFTSAALALVPFSVGADLLPQGHVCS